MDIIFILDESGSMSSMGNEPIQSTNNFIKDQQATLPSDGSTFTLWKFSDKPTLVIDDQDLTQVAPFKNYTPSGMTALYDTIGQAINTKLAKVRHENVICVILTDGEENSSTKFNRKKIKKMISDAETDYNWKFIYLGANQDAYAVGSSFGIKQKNCAGFLADANGFQNILTLTSSAVKNMRISSCTPSDSK